jgi:hypothetical protein
MAYTTLYIHELSGVPPYWQLEPNSKLAYAGGSVDEKRRFLGYASFVDRFLYAFLSHWSRLGPIPIMIGIFILCYERAGGHEISTREKCS